MENHEIWWLAALALGIVEMLTGTFYLLVLALGLLAGGIAAWAGLGLELQILIAAACTLIGWGLLWQRRASAGQRGKSDNPDLLLDVGARVQVEHWESPRRTLARYRGAAWQIELAADVDGAGSPGPHLIRRIDGSRLIVSPADH